MESAQKIDRVASILDETYGPRSLRGNGDPVSELVGTILSQNTSDTNTSRSFAALQKRYPTWDAVREAPTAELADTIRSGGLAQQKAPRIQDALTSIHDKRGDYDLEHLLNLPLADAKAWLTAMHGIGPKTAAIVLLFSLGRPAMPVDTHVHRVSLRLGIVPPKTSPEATADELERLLGDDPGRIYAFHVEMIEHGRRLCRARNPRCPECPLRSLCDYYTTQSANH